ALGELARTAHDSSARWDAAQALEQLAKQSPALVMDTLAVYPGDDLTVEVYAVAARIAPQVRQASPGEWESRRARLQTFARWSESHLTIPTDGRQ
ncbi:MAG: hypothetical protein M3276_07030, partial [Actinomycetota bacterium]|nr:hypothetical protein [Actinomycetota bacterium]